MCGCYDNEYEESGARKWKYYILGALGVVVCFAQAETLFSQ